MGLLIHKTSIALWQDVIKHAEEDCSITLEEEIEAYLVTLLARYTNKPEMAKQILAKAFLEALNLQESQRYLSLQHVGDQCLLFAGLFPQAANKKHVKISYFVDLGRSAYASLSHRANDIFNALALDFVVLMDVLQSIRQPSELLPLEAYDQWNEVGSQRALKILQSYSAFKGGRRERH